MNIMSRLQSNPHHSVVEQLIVAVLMVERHVEEDWLLVYAPGHPLSIQPSYSISDIVSEIIKTPRTQHSINSS